MLLLLTDHVRKWTPISAVNEQLKNKIVRLARSGAEMDTKVGKTVRSWLDKRKVVNELRDQEWELKSTPYQKRLRKEL